MGAQSLCGCGQPRVRVFQSLPLGECVEVGLLYIKGKPVDVIRREAVLPHAEIDGIHRKVVGVFDSIEALLFDRSDHHALSKTAALSWPL